MVYIDADWTGCPDTHQSTSCYAVFLSTNIVSWSSKRQNVVSRSTAEAEYRTMTNGVVKACWLRQLLQELHTLLTKRSLVGRKACLGLCKISKQLKRIQVDVIQRL
jgi:hypothetical protein